MKIQINDYSFNSMVARTGFAKVEIFGRNVEFIFSDEDAVIAGIELDLIPQPDDSDHTRIGYAKPYFSATVYENVGFEKGIQYIDNQTVLADYEATEYGEQIVSRLAIQSAEVREAIQAEATSIACCNIAPGITDPADIKYHVLKLGFQRDIPVDWEHVSQHKIASLRLFARSRQ